MMSILLGMTFLSSSCASGGGSSASKNDKLPQEIVQEGNFLVDKRRPRFFECEGANIDFADPHILSASDGNYYLYGTNQPYAYRSTDLSNWKKVGSLYGEIPYVYTGNEQLNKQKQKIHNFWGPDVFEMNGKFYMFITGPVSSNQPTDYEGNELNISVYVAEAESPLGPFEKFVMIKPREFDIMAPHSVICDDDMKIKYTKGFEYYNTIRVDFHLFEDDDGKVYFMYTGYGNKNDKTEAGNHIVICELKNPEFIATGDNPGFYYDFDKDTYVHASNPLDWPEFEGVIPTCLDDKGNIWEPYGGFARGVTESPSMSKNNGWYQLYFSCNVWSSPEYQIACVMVKDLKHFDIDTRKILSDDQIKFGRFAVPEKAIGTWVNYGSGCIFKDKEGKMQYAYHITYKSLKRDAVIKEIIW